MYVCIYWDGVIVEKRNISVNFCGHLEKNLETKLNQCDVVKL